MSNSRFDGDDVPLPLAYQEQRNPPKRPSRGDLSVRRAAAERCLDDQVIAWAGNDYRPQDRETWIEDLAEALRHGDGYLAARELERRHWEVNFDLCEILDGSWIWNAEREAIALWVTANCIRPKFDVGAEVSIRHGAGKVVGIDLAQACYTVQTAQWLTENPSQVGKSGGYYLPFEGVEAAAK